MARQLLPALLLCLPLAAAGADLKVTQLEQDVRDLQRIVRMQSQQIEELRRQRIPAGQPGALPPPAGPAATAAPAVQWLDASRWRKLQPGMSELDVLDSLGPPTSMRTDDGERVLLYAMEIGSSGFLGGSVTMRDRVVTAVRLPMLQ